MVNHIYNFFILVVAIVFSFLLLAGVALTFDSAIHAYEPATAQVTDANKLESLGGVLVTGIESEKVGLTESRPVKRLYAKAEQYRCHNWRVCMIA